MAWQSRRLRLGGVRAGRWCREPTCKPASVPRGIPRGGGHPSGTGVAAGLVRPTRGLDRAGLLRSRATGTPPIWPCSATRARSRTTPPRSARVPISRPLPAMQPAVRWDVPWSQGLAWRRLIHRRGVDIRPFRGLALSGIPAAAVQTAAEQHSTTAGGPQTHRWWRLTRAHGGRLAHPHRPRVLAPSRDACAPRGCASRVRCSF
jgi:hypothetical protein